MKSFYGRRLSVDSDKEDSKIYYFSNRSTGADGFKLALLELDKQLKPYDAEIVHTVHDEIIVEAPSILAPEISDIVKEVMEGVFTDMFPEVPFKVKETTQQSWVEK